MRGAAILLGCVMLAGCGSGGSEGNGAGEQRRRISIANPFHDGLTKARPGQQRHAMFQAIRGNGQPCQRVDNAGYQEEYRNMRLWVARCDAEQKSYAVFLAPDGAVQVRDCAEAGQLQLPRCNPLPPPAPDEFEPRIVEGAADNAFRSNGF